jgi:O-antigen/teichoic acid export membrane protein
MPPQLTGAEPADDDGPSHLVQPMSGVADETPPAEALPRLDVRGLWKNASWTSAFLLVSTVLLFFETIVLARFLGATVLGYFVLIRAYPEAVQQVLDCRTYETMVRYLGESVAHDRRDHAAAVVRLVWIVDAAAGLIAFAIVLATASIAARHIVHDAGATGLVAVYAVSQFVGTLDSASGSVTRVFDRFGLASVVGIAGSVTRFVGIVVVLALGGGVSALIYVLVGVQLASTFSAGGVALALLRRRAGFRIWGTTAILGEKRKEMLRFLLFSNITGTLKMSSDKLVFVIIGALGSPVTAAQYKVASQTGSSLMLFTGPFYQVIYPPMAKLVAKKRWDAVFTDLRRLRRTTLTFAMPGAIIASALMVPLIPLVFGKSFAPAVIPGIVVLWGVVPGVVVFWRRPLLLTLGQAGRLTKYQAIAVAIQLLLAALLVKPIGALGAAVSLLVMLWLTASLEIRLISQWRRQLHEG